MNVPNWSDGLEVVTRPGDQERIGYLREHGENAWEPMNLLGVSLGDLAPRDAALRIVSTEGMRSLADVWWCRAPRPLTEPLLDARAVPLSEAWERMVVVELTSGRALMRPMYSWPEEAGRFLAVELPATGILFRSEPIEHHDGAVATSQSRDHE